MAVFLVTAVKEVLGRTEFVLSVSNFDIPSEWNALDVPPFDLLAR